MMEKTGMNGKAPPWPCTSQIEMVPSTSKEANQFDSGMKATSFSQVELLVSRLWSRHSMAHVRDVLVVIKGTVPDTALVCKSQTQALPNRQERAW